MSDLPAPSLPEPSPEVYPPSTPEEAPASPAVPDDGRPYD